MTKSLKLKIAVFTSIFLVTVFSVYFLAKYQEILAKSNNSNSSLASNYQISSQISANQNSSSSQNSQSQISNSQNSTSSSNFSVKNNKQNSQALSPKIIPQPAQNIQNKPISLDFSLPKDAIEVPKKSITETMQEKCARITNNSNPTNDARLYYQCLRDNGIEVNPM